MKRLAHPLISCHSDLLESGWAVFAFVCVITFMSGCSNFAYRSVADGLAGSGSVYASDDDVELVGAAIPFGLKTMESVLVHIPEHKSLALAVTSGFAQYAYVYVQMPSEEMEDRDVAAAYAQKARAMHMYIRARDYGLHALGLSKPESLQRLRENPATVLSTTSQADVGLLYYTGLAWAAAISLGKDAPALVADLPVVDALIARAAALDPDYDAGGLHSFLIGYVMNRPNRGKDAEITSRHHFERAVELSEGKRVAPYVALAESVAVEMHNRREYEMLLQRALTIDPGSRPEWRLANIVMQRRARWLLARTDTFFAE
jgi:predicted anti-sigma-YlaC factor YlaD